MTTYTPDWNTACGCHPLIAEGLVSLRTAVSVAERHFRYGKVIGYAHGLYAGGRITWDQLADITLLAGEEYRP
jgi:hypothetical protein